MMNIALRRKSLQMQVASSICRYVNNVKAALDKFPELKDLGLVDLNKSVGTSKVPQDIATAIRCAKTPQRFCIC